MMTAYLAATTRLLQNPAAPTPLYATADLTSYINSARVQLAGDSKSVRAVGTLALTAGTQAYLFSAITFSAAGVQGALDVETLLYLVGSGKRRINPRPWPWFTLYELNTAVPNPGPPRSWAQYGQGAAGQAAPLPVGGGSLYISPPPDYTYTVNADCVCYPVPLVDDTTPEAIPLYWTDAVPYFAAYLALLSAQTGVRTQEAVGMFKLYQEFVDRARKGSTPLILPSQNPQVPNPVRENQIGAGGRG